MSDEPQDNKGLPDCEHKEYMLGCERCFEELKLLAKREAENNSFEAQLNGAHLAMFHVINILMNLEKQTLRTERETLDLKVRDIAKNVYLNLRQVSEHLMQLTVDPAAMAEALTLAAATIQAIENKVAALRNQAETSGDTVNTNSKPGIVLTDGA